MMLIKKKIKRPMLSLNLCLNIFLHVLCYERRKCSHYYHSPLIYFLSQIKLGSPKEKKSN